MGGRCPVKVLPPVLVLTTLTRAAGSAGCGLAWLFSGGGGESAAGLNPECPGLPVFLSFDQRVEAIVDGVDECGEVHHRRPTLRRPLTSVERLSRIGHVVERAHHCPELPCEVVQVFSGRNLTRCSSLPRVVGRCAVALLLGRSGVQR